MKIETTHGVGVDRLKMIVYGESGAGKTTLAGTIVEPTIIISAEGGLLSLQGKKIDFVDIAQDDAGRVIPKEGRIARLGEVYKYLLTEEARKKYSWIFIDSLTEISQNLVEQLNVEFPERKDSLVLYGENAKRMRGLIKSFRDLPYYNVVFTALSTVDKDESGQRFTTINMVGKIAANLPAFFDEVFYLYVDKAADTGAERRVLVTQKSERLVAKDRSGKLEKYEAADLGLIATKIKGVKCV